MNLFNLFKKNQNLDTGRKPLKLPLLPDEKNNVYDIKNLLENDIPIWTWTSFTDKPNYTAMNNMREGFLDGFACYRKENELLLEFIGIISPDYKMHLKLERISKFSNSSIFALLETEFKDAYKIFYDEHPESFTDLIPKYRVSLEYEDLLLYFESHSIYILEETDYIKKEESE